ncbi:serine hydrolase domain-containing protein [Bacillaceae bacterium W0354]
MKMDEINTIFNKYYEKNFFTGAVCLVKKDNEAVGQILYGHTNFDQKTPIKENSVFDLASVSKIITTTIILKLVSDEKIALDSTLGECLPIVKDHSVLSSITIKQLLTHSSGLIAWYPFYAELPNDDFFDILNNMPLTHGENKTIYSDLNFMLLGEVIKYQTNLSLQQAVEQYIAKPLQMDTLSYGPLSNLDDVVATEFGNQVEMGMCKERHKEFKHFRDQTKPIIGEVNDGNCHYFFKGQSGHAGIFAHAEDVSKLGNLYLKGGFIGDKSYIKQSLIEQSMQKHVEDRGLGWQINDPFPTGCGHTGFTGTSIWLVPEEKLQVVLLTNRLNVDEPKNINPFRREVFTNILNKLNII